MEPSLRRRRTDLSLTSPKKISWSGLCRLSSNSGDVGAADEHEKMPPSSHEQRLHDDDDHEVTTLEAGSEERTGPIRKTAVEDEGEAVEQVGGDAMEELPRRPQRLRRQYKI